jgi:hypothetical protein
VRDILYFIKKECHKEYIKKKKRGRGGWEGMG